MLFMPRAAYARGICQSGCSTVGKKDARVSEDTMLVHDERHSQGAISPPIYQTSLFSFESYQSMVDRFGGDTDQSVYSRVGNPTVSVLLDKI